MSDSWNVDEKLDASLRSPLMQVEGISVGVQLASGQLRQLVSDVSFEVYEGMTLGIVGETGAGKSLAIRAALNLLNRPLSVLSGRSFFDGKDLLALNERELRGFRGSRIGMVVQNPKSSLHPMYRVRKQMTDCYLAHTSGSVRDAELRASEMLARMRIDGVDRVLSSYPHQLSGGMAQRVQMATAMVCNPSLLVLDEPTTGLDATVQKAVLDDLRDVLEQSRAGAILITHDLGLVAEYCEKVIVMYGGHVMEEGPTKLLFSQPFNPYTLGLLIASDFEAQNDFSDLSLHGAPRDPDAHQSGCPLIGRCPLEIPICDEASPSLKSIYPGATRRSRCHRLDELLERTPVEFPLGRAT